VKYRGSERLPGVTLSMASSSEKLAPVRKIDRGPGNKPGVEPVGPYCASTYVSINATCPSTCGLKGAGCYAQSGSHRRIMGPLDDAAHAFLPDDITAHEATVIRRSYGGKEVPQDGARGGRDLRLHVGGDVPSERAATWLADATRGWLRRGGGTVWTYTHRWREIPAEAFGLIAVWASCESTAEVKQAQALGYRAAVVVAEHPSERLYVRDNVRILPCPFETRKKTCVECRLCLDAPVDPSITIGFAAHGGGKKDLKRRLTLVS
jgi:hypothetical protein